MHHEIYQSFVMTLLLHFKNEIVYYVCYFHDEEFTH